MKEKFAKIWRITETVFWIAMIPMFMLFCNLAGQKFGEFIVDRITGIWDNDKCLTTLGEIFEDSLDETDD